MSDTPRTDAHSWHDGDYDDPLHALSDFARQLERELNAANVEIEEKRKDVVWLATEKAKLENYVTELENRLRALWDKYDGDRKHYMDRIKRLEQAGDTMANAYRQICYDAYDDQQVDNWFKAKEAKP